MAAAWRALLRHHDLGPDGHCQTCGAGRLGRWPLRRRAAGLCTVWQVAVAYFIRRTPTGER
ncbi:hypothetical protein AB0K15_22810 [Amycolatopsis sp. NPDC049253]|uniref:hypothetical protein n=1 Tax=Amycolatopsis sp. NPDC049253 TaxID=3155274 RepID=UPI00343DB66A